MIKMTKISNQISLYTKLTKVQKLESGLCIESDLIRNFCLFCH